MEAAGHDDTQDWLLPGQARPPLIGELEQRIDLALATARASEAAVTKVGAAALDAAGQARRAAELAERASAAALEVQKRLATAPAAASSRPPARQRTEPVDESLSSFSERADRLVARLRGLQRIPLAAPAASAAAGQPQPAR